MAVIWPALSSYFHIRLLQASTSTSYAVAPAAPIMCYENRNHLDRFDVVRSRNWLFIAGFLSETHMFAPRTVEKNGIWASHAALKCFVSDFKQLFPLADATEQDKEVKKALGVRCFAGWWS